jgi:CBS domain-containing protein
MKAVIEIMQAFPPCCGKNDNVDSVMDHMFLTGTKFLPVVDENRHLVGTITYEEMCRAVSDKKRSGEGLKAHHVMNPEAPSINMHDDEAAALSTMRHHHQGRLPVVDFNNSLTGMVSFMSIARRMIKIKSDLKNLDNTMKKRSTLPVSA